MPGLVQPVSDESEALLAYLAQQRYVVRLAAFGLGDDQARSTPSPSALSVGGIIKHLAAVERFWMQVVRGELEDAGSDSGHDYEDNFRLLPSEELASVMDDYAAAGRETEATVLSIADLSRVVYVPHSVPWFPPDVDYWTLRWVLLHLITETARHAGHGDIVRETLDGATAFPLMAAAERWPASPWIRAWEPAS
ncbi:MAG: DinB family protein [Acidimicrobiales bacterium]|jgi:uncharacterized damage-inducible protein DinB